MAEIVNLKRVKKAKARADKEAEAASNRAQFGTPKNLRELAKAQAAQDAKKHSGHKKDD